MTITVLDVIEDWLQPTKKAINNLKTKQTSPSVRHANQPILRKYPQHLKQSIQPSLACWELSVLRRLDVGIVDMSGNFK